MIKKEAKPKIIVVLGPTASGKSDLAVLLAKKFNGEVICADSRQVYKDMDIGTGKITRTEMQNIPHHLLDVVSPKRDFSVSQYQKLAEKALRDILKRDKLPIICGGTGFYIDSLIHDTSLPPVKADKDLRAKLERESISTLYKRLCKLDPARGKTIDSKNRRRLIRALEIVNSLGAVPEIKNPSEPYNTLSIGISCAPRILEARIGHRLIARIRAGMLSEIQKLHISGVSWKRLENFGLEYRYGAYLLQNKIREECKRNTGEYGVKIRGISERDMNAFIYCLNIKIRQYAKRQMTWFKRNKDTHWITRHTQAIDLANDFFKERPA